MTERPLDTHPGATPRDMAALYAQAQMKSTRYWDFSASRQEVRGQFGHRERPEMIASPGLPVPAPEQIHAVVAEPAMPAPRQEAQDAPLATRWYALHSVLFPSQAPSDPVPAVETEYALRPPMVAVLSAAGGVGKTCLVATLGRALSGLGEQVLLVDMSASSLLPFYFASREVKPGVVRTFSSPVQPGQSDAPVRVLTLDGERYYEQGREPDPLLGQLVRSARGASRLLVDVGTVYRNLPGRLLQMRPTVLVPILPDISSLAGLASLEALLGGASDIFYLLNQFDASLPLHVDVRAMLQQQLGVRLLPFVLHRSPAISEALAEGMTVIDYAPGSGAAEDYRQLASWLRSFAAPTPVSYGGMRWTER